MSVTATEPGGYGRSTMTIDYDPVSDIHIDLNVVGLTGNVMILQCTLSVSMREGNGGGSEG